MSRVHQALRRAEQNDPGPTQPANPRTAEVVEAPAVSNQEPVATRPAPIELPTYGYPEDDLFEMEQPERVGVVAWGAICAAGTFAILGTLYYLFFAAAK